jgi:hypothetical protein
MKTIAYFGMLLIAFVLFQRCQPTQELQPTADKNRSAKLIGGSGYNLTFLGVTPSSGGYTWTYSLSRDINGNNNLEEVYIPLGECLSPEGVVDPTTISVIKDNKGGAAVGGISKAIVNNQIAITSIGGMGSSQTWFISFTSSQNAVSSPGSVTIVQKESGTPTTYTDTDVIDTPGACTDVPPPAPCAFSQGYWFRKPGIEWGGDLLVGGNFYNKTDGVAIFNARGSKGNASLSNAFTQLAAMRLNYGAAIPGPVSDAVKTIEKYLDETIDVRLATNGIANSTLFNKTTVVPTPVKNAIKSVGNWICTHHCDDMYTDNYPSCDPTYMN